MKLTIIHPAMGHRQGESYIRSWQMEPLAPAALAALTPPEVTIRFYDDRLETIPYEEPTDLVALSVETFTAKRAYQIASLYRRRGVPVVMGGFHPTLCPDEAARYAESVVVGEAENLWPRLIEDYRRGRPQKFYCQRSRPTLTGLRAERSIFRGKRYLPVGLVEASRGCNHRCDFCSIQSFFARSQNWRPIPDIIAELERINKPLIFFVDDNITADMERAKQFFAALIPRNIRWVSQASINVAHDEEALRLLEASGCQGLLIGFESLNPENLRAMNKGFNLGRGGFETALANLRRYGIRLYITFVIGYDYDRPDSLAATLDFVARHRFFIAAFNNLTPFPGTPLYERLRQEGRLRFERWWLDPAYRYGMLPFHPRGMTAEMVEQGCLEARQAFYSLPSILKRSLDFRANSSNLFMWYYFFFINLLMRGEISRRMGYPLGDESFTGPLLAAD